MLLLSGNAELTQRVVDGLNHSTSQPRIQVVHLSDPDGALARAENDLFDVVVIDGTSRHLDSCTFLSLVRDLAVELPIVVLLGADADQLAMDAIAAGAQDCVDISSSLDAPLTRAVLFAIERRRFLAKLIERDHHEAVVRGHKDLREPTPPPPRPADARSVGVPDLRVAWPDEFDHAVEVYGELLDNALEEKYHRMAGSTAHIINNLAQRMGARNAGPRDVIDVHKAAMCIKMEGQPDVKIKAYIDEGRLLVLRLMGHLLSYYRSLSW